MCRAMIQSAVSISNPPDPPPARNASRVISFPIPAIVEAVAVVGPVEEYVRIPAHEDAGR
jgi:hypothetical protein